MLEIIEINPSSTPDACFICLHGLGASGHDFVDIMPLLGVSQNLSIRYVLPHAPMRKVDYLGGNRVRAWFNIKELNSNSKEYIDGITSSDALIKELIEHEISHSVPASRIILAGFSQGGVMALFSGLSYPKKLGGVVSLSAWLVFADSINNDQPSVNQKTPIFMAHGIEDEVVPISWARNSLNVLDNLGYNARLHEYHMSHSVCVDEIASLSSWINQVLS